MYIFMFRKLCTSTISEQVMKYNSKYAYSVYGHLG